MSRTHRRAAMGWVLLGIWAGMASAAEHGQDARAVKLADRMPAGTLLYIGWPGADTLGQASKDTAWGKMLAEPRVVQFRNQWNEKVWPAIDERVREEIEDPEGEKVYGAVLELLADVWKYPTALGFVGVEPGEKDLNLDAGLIIRAGAEAKNIAAQVEKLMLTADPTLETRDVAVAGATLKELVLSDSPPIRYGVLGEDFVITVGTKLSEHWSAGAGAKGLSASERFATPAEYTGVSSATPVFFLDTRGIMETAERFGPMIAKSHFFDPLAKGPGFRKFCNVLGLDKIQSISLALRPEAGGFALSAFLHAPGIGPGGGLFGQKPLTDDDLRIVPKDVYWASVDNLDFAAIYKYLLNSLQVLLTPETYKDFEVEFNKAEQKLGFKIHDDLLASFQDTWVLYDSPKHNGLWMVGLTIIAELRPDNRLQKSLVRIVETIGGNVPKQYVISLQEQEYRDQKIHYVMMRGVPVPMSPAWTEYNGRWIFALSPQVVQTVLDNMMDKGPSLLDHPDFQRGRKLMPANYSSIGYSDAKGGMRQLYTSLLQLAPMGMGFVEQAGIPLDTKMLPPADAVTKHMFGTVEAAVTNKDGVLSVSHGAYPIPTPAASAVGGMLPMMAGGTLLPSLTRAREQARTAASAARLKAIGVAVQAYAIEHDGKFPEKLTTLVDQKYLELKEKDALSDYEYIAGQTDKMAPGNVLAYEKTPRNGRVYVLFIDGHVELMTEERLQEKLEATKKAGEL